ncbi:MAG: hypothetical protein MMC33_007480 [Icmadophila ericetorum]|nr:hypothetical protein [Icmadophila ericetorum]
MSEQLAPGAVPTPALTVSTKKRSCSFEGPTPKRSRSAAPSRVQSICGWLAEVKQLDGPVEEEGVWILRAQQKLNSDISNDPDLEKRASIGKATEKALKKVEGNDATPSSDGKEPKVPNYAHYHPKYDIYLMLRDIHFEERILTPTNISELHENLGTQNTSLFIW